ncbi:MAG: general secretion pathway protein GspK [Verrucomicrobia bacterium]|nr:general secretion pathway protein GspK [Verrucomicrobiota bacterium]
MKSARPKRGQQAGIALVIVMLVIVVLTILAAGFAVAMKVEIKLARNAQSESEMFLLAWSGVELARYVIGQQANIPGESGFHALNQKWAGGPGGTNDLLADISLENVQLGRGRFTVRIADAERKLNLNSTRSEVLEQALRKLGVDALDVPMIIHSIEDWRDPDQNTQLNGAESDYYLSLDPPYVAKDGPIDDISELLLVRGVTDELYWGWGDERAASKGFPRMVSSDRSGGLVDLFTTSPGVLRVNINTASAAVLRLLPGIDDHLAESIVEERAGSDLADGTEDDNPFHSLGELINVRGILPLDISTLQRFCGVQSRFFDVEVEVEVDQYTRLFQAQLDARSPRNITILRANWR